jgi:O-antigen ligase
MTAIAAARVTASWRFEGRTPGRLLLLLVAWGTLLFGAVYPWAYVPLLIAAVIFGLSAWLSAPAEDRAKPRPVLIALLVVAVLVVIQLIPLPVAWVARMSHATDGFLREYDLAYGVARADGQFPWHALSIAPTATARGLSFLLAFVVFLAGCIVILPRISLGWLVRRLMGLGVGVAIFGILQRLTFNDHIYWVWTPVNVASNTFGPFVNRNHFATWMLMVSAVAAGYFCGLLAEAASPMVRSWRDRAAWLSSSRTNEVVLTGCGLLLMLLSIVWTLSRSGIAAAIASGALVSVCAVLRLQGGRRFIAAGFVMAALAVAVFSRGAGDVIEWSSRTSTLAWRVQLWQDTLPIIRDFRWWGTGLNTYGVSTLVYPMTDGNWHPNEAHSDYLQVLSEGGIVLSIAAVAAAITIAMGIRRAFRQPQRTLTKWIRAGAVVGLGAVAIQESVDFGLQMPGNATMFAVLLAIALHDCRVKVRQVPPISPSRTSGWIPPSGRQLPVAVPVLAVFALVAAGCGTPPTRAGLQIVRDGVKAQYHETTGRLRLLEFDADKNGAADSVAHMDGARVLFIEVDDNEDGKVDRWDYYGPEREIEKTGLARAGDGKLDTWFVHGSDGLVERVEVSTRRDGVANRVEYYDAGRLVRSEEDTNADGQTDKWETYRLLPGGNPANPFAYAVATAAFDFSARGRPERRFVYSPAGGIERVEVDSAGGGRFVAIPRR